MNRAAASATRSHVIRRWLPAALTVLVAHGAHGGAQSTPAVTAAAVYRASCAPCHGVDGNGKGPLATLVAPFRAPAPRDFTAGRYKLRSTPSGSVPTDDDLLRTITRGIPRYMPGFASLDESVRRGLVRHLQRFSDRFASGAPEPVVIPPAPALAADAVSKGKRAYEKMGCPACHGPGGRGDGPAANALRDTTGRPLAPADLAQPGWFKGGNAPGDVYRTLVTGFDGTPMPGYADVLRDMEPETPWNLIAFIESLATTPPPAPDDD